VAIWSTLPSYPGQLDLSRFWAAGRPGQGKPYGGRLITMLGWHVDGDSTRDRVHCTFLANRGKMDATSVRDRLKPRQIKVVGMGGTGLTLIMAQADLTYFVF